MKNIHITRHAVIVAVCLILVFGAGFLTHKAWNNKVIHDRIVASAQKAKADYIAKKQAEHVAAEKAKIKSDCDAQVAYYTTTTAKMTPLQKKNVPAPACRNLEIVQ